MNCNPDMMVAKMESSNLEETVNVNNNKMRIRVSPKGLISSASSSSKVSSCDGHAQLLLQNYAHFKRSGEPGRVMYYDDGGSWVDYPKEIVDLVKSSFAEGRPVAEVKIQGVSRFFDFYRMLEIEFDTGYEKSIAWIDVNGKCFFPQVFVNSSETFLNLNREKENDASVGSECQKIEIEVRICENSKPAETLDVNEVNWRKRKSENEEIEVEEVKSGKSEGSSSNFQGKRRHISVSEMGIPWWPKTRLLREEEKGYMIAKNLFLSELRLVEPGATITRIHQCTRTGLLEKVRYDVFSKQMEITQKARGESNVVFAWHGTSAEGVESILAHGFGMPSKMQGSQMLGVGVYLSSIKFPHNSAMLSEVDNNGEKHVILCRVILGKCEKVEAGSQQSFPSSLDFDTGVDSLENPRCYVVWCNKMNSHILPELVVSYKPANHAPGQINGASSAKLVPPSFPLVVNLFSRLRRSLPHKVQELQILCGSYKDGKMGKDIFIKQLRSIVGDEMLRSTIHGIHG